MKGGSSGQKEGLREIELDGIMAEQMNSVIEHTHTHTQRERERKQPSLQ